MNSFLFCDKETFQQLPQEVKLILKFISIDHGDKVLIYKNQYTDKIGWYTSETEFSEALGGALEAANA